jgi:hypothetical protein
MNKRRPMRGLDRNQRSHLGPFRLVLEPLEARRLLAGLQVSVYLDQDHSRNFDPATDRAAPNRLVYVDLNANGRHDSNEPLAITDPHGSAFFADLEMGNYSVGLLTNSALQQQIEPVALGVPELVTSESMDNFVASNDLSIVWTLTPQGVARRLTGPDGSPTEVALGKIAVLGSVSSSDSLSAIIETDSGWQWIDLDLRSAELERQPLLGLSSLMSSGAAQLHTLADSADGPVVLIQGSAGPMLGTVSRTSSLRQLTNHGFTSAYAIAASPSLSSIVALAPGETGGSVLRLLDPKQGFRELASLAIDDHASTVTLSRDGQLALVSLSAGGVLAIEVGPQTLSLAAILHEAVGQVVATSSDGRIVTGSDRSPREIITWDTRQWLPIARTPLATGSTPFGLPRVAMEPRGDRVLALAGRTLQTVDMAQPISARASLPARDATAHVRLGVRAPVAPLQARTLLVQRTTAEDADDRFRVGQWVVEHGGGEPLWFEVDVPAQHGELEPTDDGYWRYVPTPNFSGEDSATLRVYDGQQATELVMRWQVAPMPDSPTAIASGEYSLLENAEAGTRVGPLTIVDPDLEGSYQITTSDSRFEVYGGYLYLVNGQLDFETEPSISFTVTALDYYSDYSVSTIVTVAIIDVNERPFSLRLSGGQVPENEPGAVVGHLSIVDPDRQAQYAFYVFDSRFQIVGRVLKLVEGVALDYEMEPVVHLTVAATDGTHEVFEVLRINVIDRVEESRAVSAVALDGLELQARVPGAPVGAVSVIRPQDDSYQFAVSDGRFEIVGGLLKLRDHQQIASDLTTSIALTITATGNAGDEASADFRLTVIGHQSPYHNSRLPEDVNGDGFVSPIDVLIIVNSLNLRGTFAVPSHGTAVGESPVDMPDVNGDGVVSPVDALQIINHINRNFPGTPVASGEDPEPEGEAPAEARYWAPADIESQAERRRRDNRTLDAELEALLEQLSQAKRY